MKNRYTTKFNELMSDLRNGHASKPYTAIQACTCEGVEDKVETKNEVGQKSGYDEVGGKYQVDS